LFLSDFGWGESDGFRKVVYLRARPIDVPWALFYSLGQIRGREAVKKLCIEPNNVIAKLAGVGITADVSDHGVPAERDLPLSIDNNFVLAGGPGF
jgi:hypothetical protein